MTHETCESMGLQTHKTRILEYSLSAQCCRTLFIMRIKKYTHYNKTFEGLLLYNTPLSSPILNTYTHIHIYSPFSHHVITLFCPLHSSALTTSLCTSYSSDHGRHYCILSFLSIQTSCPSLFSPLLHSSALTTHGTFFEKAPTTLSRTDPTLL